MRIEIEIPEEFENDYTIDKFAEFLGRVKADIDYNGMCGNYERETADVLAEAFKNSRVVQPVAYKGGRLIDADKLIELMIKDRDYAGENGFMDMFHERQHLIGVIKVQPTAYDVDAVVKQLDRASDYYEFEEQGREHVQMVDFEEAVEIVKGGGVDAKTDS